jgi:hypothetical protein
MLNNTSEWVIEPYHIHLKRREGAVLLMFGVRFSTHSKQHIRKMTKNWWIHPPWCWGSDQKYCQGVMALMTPGSSTRLRITEGQICERSHPALPHTFILEIAWPDWPCSQIYMKSQAGWVFISLILLYSRCMVADCDEPSPWLSIHDMPKPDFMILDRGGVHHIQY